MNALELGRRYSAPRMEDDPTPIWCDHTWPTGATCEGRARWSVAVSHEGNGSARPGRARRLACDGHLYETLIAESATGGAVSVRRVGGVS